MAIDIIALGARIRELRIKEKLTQEALAEKAGTSRVFIGLIENGVRAPSLATFITLANALHTSTDSLLAGSLNSLSSDAASLVKELLMDCSSEENSILIDNMRDLRATLKKYKNR